MLRSEGSACGIQQTVPPTRTPVTSLARFRIRTALVPFPVVLVAALSGCGTGTIKLDDSGGASNDSVDTVDSGDTAEIGDTDTGGDSAETADTSETGDSGGDTGSAAITELTARVHPVMGSIIELRWTQTGDATVHGEYSFDDGVWLSTPTYTVGDGSHRLLLLGIPFGTNVTWRLMAGDIPVAADADITTGSLPADFPMPDHLEGDPAATDADTPWIFTSLSPGGGALTRAWSFILDRQGRIVWATEAPSQRVSFMPLVSVDGVSFLIDQNSWWGAFDGGVNSQVVRMDIEGTTLATYRTPGLIHPFTETGDGAIVWSASLGGSSAGEELDILDPDGTQRRLLDCNSFVRSHGEGACGSNALFWDPATNRILYSLYSAETLLDIDESGTPVRWFGHMEGSWTFADPDSTFYWQHGGNFLADGHLLLSSRLNPSANETVVREYALDEANEQLVEVWNFGIGEGVWAYVMGEARRLPGGDTIHNYGTTPRIREATPADDVVWDISWTDTATIGRMTGLGDLYPFWGATP